MQLKFNFDFNKEDKKIDKFTKMSIPEAVNLLNEFTRELYCYINTYSCIVILRREENNIFWTFNLEPTKKIEEYLRRQLKMEKEEKRQRKLIEWEIKKAEIQKKKNEDVNKIINLKVKELQEQIEKIKMGEFNYKSARRKYKEELK